MYLRAVARSMPPILAARPPTLGIDPTRGLTFRRVRGDLRNERGEEAVRSELARLRARYPVEIEEGP